ncbi:MAG: hypothetical protein COA74_11475 [Gammaproteobacteria bacterium]|nr:MAG: hypothetical protein COA74_11475 [Gammaproteobacteria bacterium]
MFLRNKINKLALSITVALTASVIMASSEVENIDLSQNQPVSNRYSKQIAQEQLLSQVKPVSQNIKNNLSKALGVTTFSWKNPLSPAFKVQNTYFATGSGNGKNNQISQASDFYLEQSAFQHGLNKSSIKQALLKSVSNQGKGAIITRYHQQVSGIDVFNREINLMMNQQLEHIATSGYFSDAKIDPLTSNFVLNSAEAIQIAFQDVGGSVNLNELRAGDKAGVFNTFSSVQIKSGSTLALEDNTRIKQVYFPLTDKLEPAFYTEIIASDPNSTSALAFSYVISAIDGKILFRNNLISNDTKTYRVFADPSGVNKPMDGPTGNDLTPNPTGAAGAVTEIFQTPSLITLDNGPISTNDPWLVGTDETNGNNVDAYVDISAPDGFGGAGDARATTTSTDTFDYTHDYDLNSITTEARNAAVVNLFYVNNFLHDWFYDNGFDEAAGNAQVDNYSRGGIAGDPLLAEGQDFDGFDNANMRTPSDGGSPVMQMFLFRQGDASSSLSVTGLGTFTTTNANFGPVNFNTTADLVQLIDDPLSSDPNDACEAITNTTELNGNIAVINRGECTFVAKVKLAQDAGSVGVLMINNVLGNDTIVMGGEDASITIASLMVGNDDGTSIITAMESGGGLLSATLQNSQSFRDGTLDNGIIAHEWGHYLSNRLVGNSNGLNNAQGRGMGEGWSDFIAQMMILRESDRSIVGNENFEGAYAPAGYYVGASYYYGFRRAPYSTDMNKNALTFRHIEDGVALPTTHTVRGDASGANNSQVHNTGEIWANALWEVYVSLLNRPGLTFTEAEDRMKNYLVAGMKMTPVSPTFIEARDGILAAAAANDATDFGLIFAAFAKRGMGINAVAPDRWYAGNAGVVEDFNSAQNSFIVVTKLLNTGVTDSDGDNALDVGDTGSYSITIENKGSNALNGVTAQITSVADISFSNNGVLSFSDLASFGDTATASVDITLNSAGTAEDITLIVSFPVPMNAPTGLELPVDFQESFKANFDLTKTRTDDDVEISELSNSDFVRTSSNSTFVPFTIASVSDLSLDLSNTTQVWWGVDNTSEGTTALELPEVEVAASGDFVLSFYHFYSFEVSEVEEEDVFWDGGVIEVSIDGGAYQDVTALGGIMSSPYSQTLSAGAVQVGGRQGFGGLGGDETITITFADGTLNGSVAQFRFLIGTDQSVGGFGWLIDDISFTNIVGNAFSGFVADGFTPSNIAPTVTVTDLTTVTSGNQVNITATGDDDDNDTLTYLWSQVSGPGSAIDISGSNTSTTLSFTAPTVSVTSSYVFQVVVNDGTVDSTAAETSVVVNPTPAPPPTQPPPQSGGGGGSNGAWILGLLSILLVRQRRLQKIK